LRSWPICGMPRTVNPTAPPNTSAIGTSPLRKDRGDAALNGTGKATRPRVPGGFRVAHISGSPSTIRKRAVAVAHRSLKRNKLPQAARRAPGHRGIAPDRQQRVRQPL
jgi:hypothetical protein